VPHHHVRLLEVVKRYQHRAVAQYNRVVANIQLVKCQYLSLKYQYENDATLTKYTLY